MRSPRTIRPRRPPCRLRLAAVCLLCLALAPAAGAVPLPFSGRISFEVGGQPAVHFAGVGVADVVTGAGGIERLSVPGGVFAGTTALPVASLFAPIVQLSLAFSNAPIVLSAARLPCNVADPALGCLGTGPLHGRAGLEGQAVAGLLGSFGAPLTSLRVDLGPVGGAGAFLGTNTLLPASASLLGAGWTTGTVFAIATHGGVAIETLVATGSASPGSLALVTPFAIRSTLQQTTLAGIARIELQLVPEPASGLLLGIGLLALARGRRCARSPRV